MSKRLRDHPLLRAAAAMVPGCALAAVLLAATPAPQLDELDEVVATGKLKPIQLKEFLEFPRYDSVVISPQGTHIAMGWGEENLQRRVSVIDFPSMKPRSTGLLKTYHGVTDIQWLDEDRLLVQPDWPLLGLRRIREPLGSILITDVDGHTVKDLYAAPVGVEHTDMFGYQRQQEEATKLLFMGPDAFGPVRLIKARTGELDHILFQTLRRDSGYFFNTGGYGIFQLDVASNTQTRVAMLPLRGGRVITGPENRAALVAGANEADEQVVYYLPEDVRAEGRKWQRVARSKPGERGLRPLAWTGQGEEYYALEGRNQPTRAVVIWNAKDNTERLLYQHPDADMDVMWQDPAGIPWMFSGNRGVPVYWYPDPAHPLAHLHRILTLYVAPEIVDVMNATDDLSKAVVRISSGKRPPIFLVVDVKTTRSLTGMNSYPALKPSRLSPAEPIEFRARDGLLIRGYLTRPVDENRKPVRERPLLVISHAGPRGEALDARYDFERELFASRGYAVLQVNARGTTGRGVTFEKAGDGNWGHEVQDDFADGVRWAINQGVTVAGHVCFYGTGFGAYSAMMAAAREPNLFQCVIGVAGMYDLPRLLGSEAVNVLEMGGGPIVRRTGGSEEVGSREIIRPTMPQVLQRAFSSDRKELWARSPASQASSIKAKVLLMHQENDQHAPAAQIESMRQALSAAGNPPATETIGTGQGYAGYFTPATRVPVYSRMLSFLDKHIDINEKQAGNKARPR